MYMESLDTHTDVENPNINALGYICELYTKGKLAVLSDEETLKLYDDLIAFDQKMECPWEISELEFLISDGYPFPEIIAGMTEWLIPNISYENGKYQKNTTLGADHTITGDRRVNYDSQSLRAGVLDYWDELRLSYAKKKIFAFMRKRQQLNPELHDKIEECIRVSDFFNTELAKLCAQYPETYTNTDYRFYADAHTPEEIFEKTQDKKRWFIRYVQDKSGGIIAYFESRKNPTYSDTQVVQWIFVSETERRKWIVPGIWQEFESWCRENRYKSIWSDVALRDTTAQKIHEILLPQSMRWIKDPNTYTYVQWVSE